METEAGCSTINADGASETGPMGQKASGARKNKNEAENGMASKVMKTHEQQKSRVYQFKITLLGLKPPIWRRIQVPEDYTFFELHVAIQNAMGWQDYHLHVFNLYKNPKSRCGDMIGVFHGTDEDQDDDDEEKKDKEQKYNYFRTDRLLSGKKIKIASRFKSVKDKAMYEYDLGFPWRHDVVLEKIEPAVAGQSYPRCLTGRRACPPEGCEGWTDSYEDLKAIVKDPNHPDHKEIMELVGGPFDPDAFDPKSVVFQDPKSAISYGYFDRK